MRSLLIFVSVLTVPLSYKVFASEGDDTLRYFLSKSDLAVAGRVASEPVGISSEMGVVEYVMDFQIADVLHGNVAVDGDLRLGVVRFELRPGDELSWLKKGAKAILFLKSSPGDRRGWVSADPWFGIQPDNHLMTQSLKRLAAERQAEKLPMVRGVVLTSRENVVEVSLGSDDGIGVGQDLYWYRDGVNLGRLRVVSAVADRAMTEMRWRNLPKSGPPRRNDEILTRSR